MENKITSLWNKIKITRDTFSKIALIKEFDDLVTKYKEELIKKFAEMRGEDGNSAKVKADDGSLLNKLRGAFRF